MNSFNTQLQIEDMYDQDDYAALLQYCEERAADADGGSVWGGALGEVCERHRRSLRR